MDNLLYNFFISCIIQSLKSLKFKFLYYRASAINNFLKKFALHLMESEERIIFL